MAAGATMWSELDDISLELKQCLNIPNLRPFLRNRHLLTEEELEKVEISAANPRDQAIDKFVSILKTKGPNHSRVFLEILRLSLEQEDSHMGHRHLSERLEQAILERQEASDGDTDSQLRDVVRQIPIPRPAHRPCCQNDSGLGHHSMSSSSGASSQDTSLSQSFFSGVSASTFDDSYDHHAQGRLRNRGLENLENEPAHRRGLDERQISKLKYKITSDFNNITSRFAVMVLGIYRLLKGNSTPLDEVRLMLQYLGCRTNAGGNENVTLFSSSSELSESKDLEALIACLQKYSSWYNYRLVKLVAEQFSGEEGRKLISDYETDLRRHYVTLIAYQCPDFGLDREVPPGYARLIVKVDWDYLSASLQDITVFQSSLADILELEPYVFQLRTAEEGCVRLEWSMPAGLEPHVSSIMVVKEECLRELRVLSVAVIHASDSSVVNIVIRKHQHTPKECLMFPLVQPRKATLSATSSIVSVLDVPMSSVEAEILSLYDSSSSSNVGSLDGDELCQSFSVVKDDQPEIVSSLVVHHESLQQDDNESNKQQREYNDRCQEKCTRGCRDFRLDFSAHSHSALSTMQSAVTTPVTTPTIVSGFRSESNLLSPCQPPSVRYAMRREGRSMPDILGEDTDPHFYISPVKSVRPSIICSLKKLPKCILKRFLSSQRKQRKDRETEHDSYLQPFPLMELSYEPRKIGKKANESAFVFPPRSADESLQVSPSTGTGGTTPYMPFSSSEFLDGKVDVSPAAGVENTFTNSSASDHGFGPSYEASLTSSQDHLFPRQRPVGVWRHHDSRRISRDSGVTTSFNSTHSSRRSSSTRPYVERFQRQTSADSADTDSIASSKRNSLVASHHTSVIHECFGHPEENPNTMQVIPADIVPSEEHVSFPPLLETGFQARTRSRSHDEGFYNRIKSRVGRIPSSDSSAQSSGYSSFAGSVAHVNALVAHDGLSSDSTVPMFAHRSTADAFPLRPSYHKAVVRGKSWNATRRFRTGTQSPAVSPTPQLSSRVREASPRSFD